MSKQEEILKPYKDRMDHDLYEEMLVVIKQVMYDTFEEATLAIKEDINTQLDNILNRLEQNYKYESIKNSGHGKS